MTGLFSHENQPFSSSLSSTQKTSYVKAKKSDLTAYSEPLALVRHDQTLMQLSWMLKYYGEQRPSSCAFKLQNLHLQMCCAFKLQNLHLKCVVPSSCRTSTFKCVFAFKLQNLLLQMCCAFKLQNLHFHMCLCLQVAEPPPSNVFVPSSCRTPTFKYACAFKLQNLHLQMFCAFKLQNLHLQMCCAFKLQNLHLQMCCAFKLQNLQFQMCLHLQVAEPPPSNVFVPSSCRTSTFKMCLCFT